MARVQLYVSKTRRGFKNLVNINPSDDVVRHIHDMSPALEILRFNGAQSQVYVVSYLTEGVLLSIVQPVSGEGHDNYCATFYIPENIKIDIDRVYNLIDAASSLIAPCADPSPESLSPLRHLLNEEYPESDIVALHYPSVGHNYAYVRYGSNAPALDDYMKEKLYQHSFSSYAGIVFIDTSKGVEGLKHARDLTPERVQHIVCIMPPPKTSSGFTPMIGRRPFESPLLAAEGYKLNIEWRRGGFEPIYQEFIVPKGGGAPAVPDTQGARRVISPSTFYVSEQGSRRQIDEYIIKVNGVEISGPKAFTFSDLKNAQVEIEAPGYFPFSGAFDLASTTQALVQMRVLHKTYRFDLPLITPEPAEPVRIYIKTIKPLTRCPIDGYAVTGHGMTEGTGAANHLVYVGGRSRNLYIYIIVIAITSLLCGILIGWMAFSVNDADEHRATPVVVVPQEQVVNPESQAVVEEASAESEAELPAESAELPADDIDYTAAAEYLSGNKNWSRAEMEAIPALRGLFDDMNNYRFARISEYWQPLLGGRSAAFDAVAKAAAGAATKRDPRTGKHAPVYTPDSDSRINWRAYTYWIDP